MTSELVAGRRPRYHHTDLLSGPLPHAVLSTVAIPTAWLSRHRTLQRTWTFPAIRPGRSSERPFVGRRHLSDSPRKSLQRRNALRRKRP
jgi:hypothetical protein